jgi:2-oxoglutarate dehydrogenase E1 component
MVFGMAHRGRLATLYSVFRKPIDVIFGEFQDKALQMNKDEEDWGNSGDVIFSFYQKVKYHLGMTTSIDCKNGQSVSLSILPNPSHLEAVNPVVQGKVRAVQD